MNRLFLAGHSERASSDLCGTLGRNFSWLRTRARRVLRERVKRNLHAAVRIALQTARCSTLDGGLRSASRCDVASSKRMPDHAPRWRHRRMGEADRGHAWVVKLVIVIFVFPIVFLTLMQPWKLVLFGLARV